ncbi:unnamed protein product [Closterium sp. NIES-64]|nr:unnamed protein product [Closterium sp. NIES-64]
MSSRGCQTQWMSVGERTIQRCWWRTGCPAAVMVPGAVACTYDDEPTPAVYPDIELDDDIDDVGTLISGLALGNAAMTAAEDTLRATRITPRNLCHLFDIRNPVIIARMERASPSLNLNVGASARYLSPGATPTHRDPSSARIGCCPTEMTRPSRRQELFDAGVGRRDGRVCGRG